MRDIIARRFPSNIFTNEFILFGSAKNSIQILEDSSDSVIFNITKHRQRHGHLKYKLQNKHLPIYENIT